MITITPCDFNFEAADKLLCSKLNATYAKRRDTDNGKPRCKHFEHILADRIGRVQLMPQAEWCGITPFTAPGVPNLCHPHHRILWHRFLETLKPESDVLVVASCSFSKPYSKNMSYRQYVKLAKKGWFDLCILSFHPVMIHPLDASAMYPNIMYDWPHADSPALTRIKAQHNLSLWVEFLARHPYKKVLFVLNQCEAHVRVYEGLKAAFPDRDLKLLWDDWPRFREYVEKHFKPGLWQNRMHSLKEVREFISHELGDQEQFRCDAKLEK